MKAADRARKLLNLAKDQADMPEGRAALKRARKILDENGWTESDVEYGDHILIEQVLPDYEEWRRSLLILVAEYGNVDTVENEEGSGLHGIEVKIAPTLQLFHTLVHRIRVAASEFSEEMDLLIPPGVNVDAHRWYTGFASWAVMGLLERLVLEESDEDDEDPAVLPEEDASKEEGAPNSPEWASLDQAIEAIEASTSGDDQTADYCREGYEFGQEVSFSAAIEEDRKPTPAAIKREEPKLTPFLLGVRRPLGS